MVDTIDIFKMVKDEIFNDAFLDSRAETFKFKVDASDYVFKEGRKRVKVNLIFHTDHISLRYNHPDTETFMKVKAILEDVLFRAKLPYEILEGEKERGLLCLYFKLL